MFNFIAGIGLGSIIAAAIGWRVAILNLVRSALCREAEQERGRDQRQQQPERVDAAVEFEFPIGVVGLPARETHVRLNALFPGGSSTFGSRRSQAIQTDLLRKLIEASRPVLILRRFISHPAPGFRTLERRSTALPDLRYTHC